MNAAAFTSRSYQILGYNSLKKNYFFGTIISNNPMRFCWAAMHFRSPLGGFRLWNRSPLCGRIPEAVG
jgi:hypothetical protein